MKNIISEYHENLWNNTFAELEKYRKKYRHCDVPIKKGKYYSLGNWCNKQRNYKKFETYKVPDYRLEKLDRIGFCWGITDRMFEQKFVRLSTLFEKHGDCYVLPSQDMALWKWCNKIREERRKKSKRLTGKRIEKLDSIGFQWEVISTRWTKKYDMLKRYIKEHKHFFYSSDKNKYKQLNSFVHNLRVSQKQGKLSNDKIILLNKIGFVWNTSDLHWGKRFSVLKKYKKKFGHCNVSKGRRDRRYLGLANWVEDQRNNYKSKAQALTQTRIEKLNSIGISWNPPYKSGDQARIKDSDMLLELKRLQFLLGKTPSILDINKHGKYHSVSYYNHFGNIQKARKKAGLKAKSK